MKTKVHDDDDDGDDDAAQDISKGRRRDRCGLMLDG